MIQSRWLVMGAMCAVLSGCVAGSRHVDELTRQVQQLAEEVAHMHPDNHRIPVIAAALARLAESGSALVPPGVIAQLAQYIPGGPGGMVMIVLGLLGIVSPGADVGKNKMLRRQLEKVTQNPQTTPGK